MSNRAPICHIPPANPVVPQPGVVTLPAIPVATNLTSALMAINGIRQTLQIITQQIQRDNGFNRKPDPNGKKSQWVEKNRTTSTVKIYQNNDPSTGNFVEVEQIDTLTMADKNTGQTWDWKRSGR